MAQIVWVLFAALFCAGHINEKIFICIFPECNCTVRSDIVDAAYEPESVPYVDTFTWQGERFDQRPMQTTKIVYNRKKRDTDHNHTSKPAPNENWSLRGDELHFGALVLVEKISIIDKYLIGPPRPPFQFSRHMFVIVITNPNEPHFEEVSATFLRKLWLNYGIANAILITPCAGGSEVLL